VHQEREFEAEAIAHFNLCRTPNFFDMQEYVLMDMEDPQVGDSGPSVKDMVVDNVST
jgi:hypothetical protein